MYVSLVVCGCVFFVFFFQAEDGIRGFCLSRGLGDGYKGPAGGGVELPFVRWCAS